MTIHDWSRVDSGIFHDFHHAWIAEIRKALNKGILPPDYHALLAPPKVRMVATSEMEHYAAKQKTVAIRHRSDDRVVAMIELVSPGNKASRNGMEKFVAKAADALRRGIHLLIVDLLPTTARDPQGIHGAIWSEIEADDYVAPPDKPLTLVAYAAADVKTAYIEPTAVGDLLSEMPLFLDAESYVPVPLEATYFEAWSGEPTRWRNVLS